MRHPMSRAAVLSAYREALRLVARLPEEARRNALADARQAMRANANATAEQVPDLMKVLVSKISFLRICTPKKPRDVGRVGYGTFVVRDGKVVEGQGRSHGSRVADGSISADEAYRKHRSLMKRQYFGREPPKYSEIL